MKFVPFISYSKCNLRLEIAHIIPGPGRRKCRLLSSRLHLTSTWSLACQLSSSPLSRRLILRLLTYSMRWVPSAACSFTSIVRSENYVSCKSAIDWAVRRYHLFHLSNLTLRVRAVEQPVLLSLTTLTLSSWHCIQFSKIKCFFEPREKGQRRNLYSLERSSSWFGQKVLSVVL